MCFYEMEDPMPFNKAAVSGARRNSKASEKECGSAEERKHLSGSFSSVSDSGASLGNPGSPQSLASFYKLSTDGAIPARTLRVRP